MKYLLIFCIILSLKVSAVIFPIFSYSEDSGLIYGAFVQKQVNKETDSFVQLFFMGQEKGHAGYLKGTNIMINNQPYNASIYGSNTGSTFYDIAEYNTDTSTYVNADSMNISIDTEYPLQHMWDLIIGIKFQHYNEDFSENDDTKYFNNLSTMGLILGTQIDKRDREINPKIGYLHQLKATLFPEYQTIEYDHRLFKPFLSGTFAYRLYISQVLTNNKHIAYYNKAGSYFYLRGYKTNRYMDKHLSYTQLEWRKPIFKWFELTPFIEYGIIGNDIVSTEESLFSYGIASHIPMGPTTLRTEFAFNETGNRMFYFGFNHVF